MQATLILNPTTAPLELPFSAEGISACYLIVENEIASRELAALSLLVHLRGPVDAWVPGSPKETYPVHSILLDQTLLEGQALRKRMEQSDAALPRAWKLTLTPAQIFSVVEEFAKTTQKTKSISDREENNRNLWRAIFAAVPKLVNDKNLEALVNSQGASAPQLAADLGILAGPAYPFGDPREGGDIVAEVILRHVAEKLAEPLPAAPTLFISPKRNPFLTKLYESRFARADWLSYHLADKLVVGKIIASHLGSDASLFHPKVLGVKELLASSGLVDLQTGEWKQGREELRSALKVAFPGGYVLKAAMAGGSKAGSFFHAEEEILSALQGENAFAYQPEEFLTPHMPPPDFTFSALAYSSGERFFLMEKIKGTALAGAAEDGFSSEVRAHSMNGKCIPEAIFTRWDGDRDLEQVRSRVIRFVEDFLARMPIGFSDRQVYSYDLFVPAEGPIAILEINTNQGRARTWSDYLRNPSVLAAYVNHLEKDFGFKFSGEEGEALRSGVANLVNHLRSDLEYVVKDEEDGGKRRDFWREEILERNVALAHKALAFPFSGDSFGYFSAANSFALGFLRAIVESSAHTEAGWPKFVAWAKQDLVASGFME